MASFLRMSGLHDVGTHSSQTAAVKNGVVQLSVRLCPKQSSRDEAVPIWSWLQMQRAIALTLLPASIHKVDEFMDIVLKMDEFPLSVSKELSLGFKNYRRHRKEAGVLEWKKSSPKNDRFLLAPSKVW